MGFAETFKQLRIERGYTQMQIAEMLDLTDAAVATWEAGKSKPRFDKITQLADLLGVSVSDLMGESSIPYGSRRIRATDARVRVRHLGKTHAGDPMEELYDETEVWVPPEVLRGHPNAFSLQVEGGCMGKVYPEGCMVVVDPDLAPRNGCAVVAETEPGESVLRRYFRGRDTLVLSADCWEGDYPDMVFSGELEEVKMLGVVVWFQASKEER